MVYEWRKGAHVKVDANVAGKELERIRKRDGKIETEVVVKEAKPKGAPLHEAFEWDDGVAAEEFRKHQARALVKSLVVVVEEVEEPEPAFVHVKVEGERTGYY